jgi:hypothetical protein
MQALSLSPGGAGKIMVEDEGSVALQRRVAELEEASP